MTDVPTHPDALSLEDLAKILDRGAELDDAAQTRWHGSSATSPATPMDGWGAEAC
jgi:hypothetical protein